MSSHTTRPRVIRKVTKKDRHGNPKIVRDRKVGVNVERVKAQDFHRCERGPDCRVDLGGFVEPGVVYAKVIGPNPKHWLRWPEERVFHFECLPDDLQPVRRFFQEA